MFTVCLFISDGVDEDDGDVCEVCVFRFFGFISLGVLEIVVFIVAVTIAVYYC